MALRAGTDLKQSHVVRFESVFVASTAVVDREIQIPPGYTYFGFAYSVDPGVGVLFVSLNEGSNGMFPPRNGVDARLVRGVGATEPVPVIVLNCSASIPAGTLQIFCGREPGAFDIEDLNPTATTITQSLRTWTIPVAVAMGAAAATIIAANSSRVGLVIQNTGAVPVFFRLTGAGGDIAADMELLPDQTYFEGEGPRVYQGAIRGLTAGAAGEVRVMEAT